jgi:hypothetical protein
MISIWVCSLCEIHTYSRIGLEVHFNGEMHQKQLNLVDILDPKYLSSLELTATINHNGEIDFSQVATAEDSRILERILSSKKFPKINSGFEGQQFLGRKEGSSMIHDLRKCHSIPKQAKRVLKCNKLSTSDFIDLSTFTKLEKSCVLVESNKIIGILIPEFYPNEECDSYHTWAKKFYDEGGVVERSPSISEGRMVMSGWRDNNFYHSVQR